MAHASSRVTRCARPVWPALRAADAKPFWGGGGREPFPAQNGKIGVWKLDNNGRLVSICAHERKFPITHCVYKAKAKSGVSSITSGFSVADQPPFFVATESGTVYVGDDMGNCNEVLNMGLPLMALLYHEARGHLVVISKSLLLAQYAGDKGGKMTQVTKVKLSVSAGGDGSTACAWLCDGHLATASSEGIIRVWELAEGNNYVLPLASVKGIGQNPKGVVLAYSAVKKMLAVGTAGGQVAFWTLHTPVGARAAVDESCWRPGRAVLALDGPARHMAWAPTGRGLAATGSSASVVCVEAVLTRVIRGDLALVQTSAFNFRVEHARTGRAIDIITSHRPKGADLSDKRVALFTGSIVEVHELNNPTPGEALVVSRFDCAASAIAIQGERLFLIVDGRLDVANLKGVVRSTLPFLETEGVPVQLHLCATTLAICTAKGVLRVLDVARNEPRQLAAGRTLAAPGAGPITAIRVNPFGTAVALLTQRPAAETNDRPGRPGGRAPASSPAGALDAGVTVAIGDRNPTMYVYSLDTDQVMAFDFGAHGLVPVDVSWDVTEPKLFGVFCQPAVGHAAGESAPGPEMATIFATTEKGLMLQDRFAVPRGVESVLELQCPFIYFATAPVEDSAGEEEKAAAAAAAARSASDPGPKALAPRRAKADSRVVRRLMRDFAGLEGARGGAMTDPEDIDASTRQALLAFSYHVTAGNMDEAYRAVRSVRATAVWENMARMCVQTRRLDVAEACLGNMGDARGVAALIAARAEPEDDARLGVLAIQLGMLDEAERLFSGCDRHDLVNSLLRARGEWDKAVGVAQEKDRIHLSATHYARAKALEAAGDIDGAVASFELAGSGSTEVPRLLFAGGRRDALRAFVERSTKPDVLDWWAKLCESTQDYTEAIDYYKKAGNDQALVRVLCYLERLDEAADLANASTSRSPAYLLARQYEARGRAREAIHFFGRAGRYNQAARLARDHGLTADLQSLSLQAPPRLQEEAADYFLERGMHARAAQVRANASRQHADLRRGAPGSASSTPRRSRRWPHAPPQLYTRAGQLQRALDLCFEHRLFDELGAVTDRLGPDSDPRLLSRCADFLVQNGQVS